MASAFAWPPATALTGGLMALSGLTDGAPAVWLQTALHMAVVLPAVTLISAYWIQRAELSVSASAPASSPEDSAKAAAAALLAELPPAARGKILALKGEDHYVRVITDRGEGLVLARLRDAAKDLDGVWTHRSFWVAKDAVQECRNDGARMRLRLLNGMEAPVARSRRREVRAAVINPSAR